MDEHGARVSEVIERGRDKAFAFGERIGQAVEQGKAGYRDAIRQGQGLAGDAMQDAEEAARAVRGALAARDRFCELRGFCIRCNFRGQL